MIKIAKKTALTAALFFFLIPLSSPLQSEEVASESRLVSEKIEEQFTPFTGKVTKLRVRMRLTPTLDGVIVRELEKEEMVLVVGEDEEFYAIAPPEDIKNYIFRTYVLDGKIEGQHVNVRLEPSVDAPVVAQLNTGDTITGRVSPSNSKWLEIVPPATARFYVSKDYIEKVGDSDYLAKAKRRQKEVAQMMTKAISAADRDMSSPFDEIDYDATVQKFQAVIDGYGDFEQQVSQAEERLLDYKNQYTKKKIAYLEAKSKEFIEAETLQKENSRLAKAYKKQQEKLSDLEKRVKEGDKPVAHAIPGSFWLPKEREAYERWTEENGNRTMEEFYQDELKQAISLKGMLQPYVRNVKNKPGDYILLNGDKTPIAFLYGTEINLQDFVGQEVMLEVAPRPNNRFAYPAYFVLSIH